jgi:serine protease Do
MSFSVLLLAALFTSPLYAANLPDYAELVEEQGPVVVKVSVVRGTAAASAGMPDLQQLPEGMPELFRRFFDQLPEHGNRQPSQGVGSGFILSADGYVLTNAHVVDGADEITVSLQDRRDYNAELIGSDERTDIALLKIDANRLPVAKTGDSDKLRVGQWVLAIGSPFGFDYTATQGIISALSRSLPDGTYVPFIQTDVAVNPGNSGGPLFDTDGRVIGVNSQIYTRSGGYMGLSFAIPINTALQVADQLKSKGFVSRGWLGVTIQDLNASLAESFGLDTPRGALVAGLAEGGPAAEAGLKSGDVILRYDDHELARSGDLPPLVGATPPGGKVELEVLRDGKTRMLRVEIGELAEDREQKVASVPAQGGRFGVAVGELADSERKGLGIKEGVKVQSVAPDSAAARAGIREGDVIAKFNGNDVGSIDDLRSLIDAAPADRAISVLVLRNGQPQFLAVTLPQA